MFLSKSHVLIAALLAGFAALQVSASCGRPEDGIIVESKGADAHVAALELQRHLEFVCGRRIPVVDEDAAAKQPPSEFRWNVGRVADGDGRTGSSEAAFWRMSPDGAWFWGGDAGGVRVAVLDYLESELGVRWPFGADVYCRHMDSIPVRAAEGSWDTPLRIHRIRSRKTNPKYRVWSGRMRFGMHNTPTFGHAFVDFWKRYKTTHPEYFAMRKDGRRMPIGATDEDPDGLKSSLRAAAQRISMCVTCPGLLDKIIADWKLAGAPEYVNICENDSWPGNCCYCPTCCAKDAPPPPDARDPDECRSDRYVDFANRVLEAARRVRPDAKVCLYAYNAATYPPRRGRPKDGVVMGMVPVVFSKAAIERYVGGWLGVGLKEFVYRPNRHYYYRMRNLPLGCEEHFFDICRYLIEKGAIGLDYDSPGCMGIYEWFADYVVAKAMRDPSKPFSYWEDHYMQSFGPAAADMKAYYAYWREKVWKARIEPDVEKLTAKSHIYDFATGLCGSLGEYYREGDFIQTADIIRAAELKAAPDARAAALVKKVKLAHENAHLTFRAICERESRPDAVEKLVDFRRSNGFRLLPWDEAGRKDACGIAAFLKKTVGDGWNADADGQWDPLPDNIWK